MRKPTLREAKYYNQEAMENAIFPEATLRHIGHMVRTPTPIPGYRAVVNTLNDETFAVVSEQYKLVLHQEIVQSADTIVAAYPQFGEPVKEMWMAHNGSRLHLKYTFTDVDYEVRPGDVIHPTLEAFASMDTTLAQRFMIGALRKVCTNGMHIGKMFAEYKRKHTEGLDLTEAIATTSIGLNKFSELPGAWKRMADRLALESEVFLHELIPFNAEERTTIENKIKSAGKVISWDDEEKENRKVEINAWDLYNILTAEATHHVSDIHRQARINDAVANVFYPQYN